jgi:hypothetical protein
MHGMACYIFLKSLRSLEEFRKNPHVKIPPKSPGEARVEFPTFPSLCCAPTRQASVHQSGRRPSSGERTAVPSVRATVGPRCTARPAPVHRAWTRCTGLTVGK